MNEFEKRKVLISFIDAIDPDTGWWYSISKIGSNADPKILEVFPTVNTILGLHGDAMDIMWLETGCLKRKRNMLTICKEGFEHIKNGVTVRAAVELSKITFGGFRNLCFLKLGIIHVSPDVIWKRFLENPRRIHPPLSLLTRESTVRVRNEMVDIVKESSELHSGIQLYLSFHFPGYQQRKKTVVQESSSESEGETEEPAQPMTSMEMYKSGSRANSKTSPLMNMFRIPEDNTNTLQRLHYEITKLLIDSKTNKIQYPHPLHPEQNIDLFSVPQGTSRTSQHLRSKIITDIIDMNKLMDKSNSNEFVDKILTRINYKYNDDFFNYSLKNGYITKQENVMSALYWNAMSGK